MYRIAICDDDKDFCALMKRMIIEVSEDKESIVLYSFTSGEEFLEYTKKKREQFHMVIMDMQMDVLTGFDTAKVWREENPSGVLAFCTGAVDIFEEALEVNPYRYIKKSYTKEKMLKDLSACFIKMKETLERVNHVIQLDKHPFLNHISIEKVSYISKARRRSQIHMNKDIIDDLDDSMLYCAPTIDQVHEELKTHGFVRPHDSYVVNISHISMKKTNKYLLHLNDGTVLTIARSRYAKLKDELTHYYSMKYD